MKLKVSFKDREGAPSKIVKTFANGNATVVVLRGILEHPDICVMDKATWKWIQRHSIVDDSGFMAFRICAKGKAKKSPLDELNPVLGERIAEARAKIKIYKFMSKLAKRICDNLEKMLVGDKCNDVYYVVPYKGGYKAEYNRYIQLLESEERHLNELLSQA
jgi:hypothetical protein